MKVSYIGHTNSISLVPGREYTVESTECGWYRIVDETGEDYLFPPYIFEVVEALPIPKETNPSPMPADMAKAAIVTGGRQ